MAAPEVLDLDVLLRPISADAPSGVALKEDPQSQHLYYDLKTARDAARAAEREVRKALTAGDEEGGLGDLDPPDWRKVRDLAVEILATWSKDLWVAAWLLEALVRLEGFAGLRDGLRLLTGLVGNFWDGIHPRPDEDGIATTVAQLDGLFAGGSEGSLPPQIAALPLTQGTSIEPLTGLDYADAADLETINDVDRRNQRIAKGAATMEMFEKAARETPPEFFVELAEQIAACQTHFQELSQLLESKCDDGQGGYSSAPPSSYVAAALTGASDVLRSIAGHVLVDAPEEHSDDVSSELVAVEEGGSASLGTAGRVASREDALNALTKVADFFRNTEPHSPLSYLLDRAVRWGRLSLPELLRELVDDTSARRDISRRTGIPLQDDD